MIWNIWKDLCTIPNANLDSDCNSRRRRIYLPQDELPRFGLFDEDIFEGKMTDKWALTRDEITTREM